MAQEAPFADSQGAVVLARLLERDMVGSALVGGVLELHGIVFPVADRAQLERAAYRACER